MPKLLVHFRTEGVLLHRKHGSGLRNHRALPGGRDG
jgi:hypothetical protein